MRELFTGRQAKVVALALVAAFLIACVVIVFAQRRRTVTATGEATRAETIYLRGGDDLQNALNAARPGDTIVLEAGGRFLGPFTLPNKPGNSFISVQSSALQSLPEGKRITPELARLLPKLISPGKGEPALQTTLGAHHFKFIGIEIMPIDASALVYDLVRLGDPSLAQNSLSHVPHTLVFDRCYIHGTAAGSLKRGIALNSGRTDIINSHISDFKVRGQEAQAIAGWNGPGPFKIVNNYLEGAGVNILFGGEDPSIKNLVPSDIEIADNHIAKPISWRGKWTVKNLIELKNAQRVTIRNNLIENNWGDAQEGAAILFTVRNQDGKAPWSVVQDVTFNNNIVRHSASALYILGRDNNQPSQQAKRITVRDNLFEDINGQRWNGRGSFLIIAAAADVIIEHNTIFQTGNIVTAFGEPNTGFVFRNNIVMHNDYGFHGDDRRPGQDSIEAYFPGSVISNNAIVGGDASLYKERNMFPPSLKALGFVNVLRGDYRLGPGSPLRGKGTGGSDIGARWPITLSQMRF